MPAFVKLIVELTKEGKEINLSHTRASYGLNYLVAYNLYEEESPVARSATTEAQEATEESVEDAPSEPVKFEQDLSALSLQELRDILTAKGIKYAPAAKEAKLIELIKVAE